MVGLIGKSSNVSFSIGFLLLDYGKSFLNFVLVIC